MYIHYKHGLRQEVHVSPVLLNQAADGMYVMLDKTHEVGLIKSFRVTPMSLFFINFQYAHDILR